MKSAQRQPSYLKHTGPDGKARARCRINGRDYYLGDYDSLESYSSYEKLIAKWKAGALQTAPKAVRQSPTVNDAAAIFLGYAATRWKDKGEFGHYKTAVKALVALWGTLDVDELTPKKLRDCVKWWASKGLVRRACNRHLRRLKFVFRWLESEEHIPGGIYHRLLTATGLSRGEEGVIEHGEVLPVPEEHLAATLPHLGRVVRAMVELQLVTGMRPGELVQLRPVDIVCGGKVELRPGKGHWLELGGVWMYRPVRHKTLNRGQLRLILIGPKGQAILAPFLVDRPVDMPCFSPKEAAVDWLVDNGRKVRWGKSRTPTDAYKPQSYGHAVAKACKRAGVPHWHPHAIRHNAASRLDAEFGTEMARILLGHSSTTTTDGYILRDLKKAVAAASEAG